MEPPANEKDYRRWEYGPGLGARAEALLLVGEHPVVQATYRYQWIHAANDTPENGGGADHDLQIASLRLRAPLGRGFGIGSTVTSSCARATTATRSSSRTTTACRRCAPTRPGGSGASRGLWRWIGF